MRCASNVEQSTSLSARAMRPKIFRTNMGESARGCQEDSPGKQRGHGRISGDMKLWWQKRDQGKTGSMVQGKKMTEGMIQSRALGRRLQSKETAARRRNAGQRCARQTRLRVRCEKHRSRGHVFLGSGPDAGRGSFDTPALTLDIAAAALACSIARLDAAPRMIVRYRHMLATTIDSRP